MFNEIPSPYHPFLDALVPVLRNLKIYRRDEERLWHALGAWPRVIRAYHTGKIPVSLSRRHYFPDAAEIVGILDESSPELDEFLERVRTLPPPEPPPPLRRRSRRDEKGTGGRKPRKKVGSPAATKETQKEGKSDGRRRRRRRTGRRKKGTSGGNT